MKELVTFGSFKVVPLTQHGKRVSALIFPHPTNTLPLPRPSLRERQRVLAAISVTYKA